MARFEDGDTIYILEWQGDVCVLTLLMRTAVREVSIPRALAAPVAEVLWPSGPEALREIAALGQSGAPVVRARNIMASGVPLEDALAHLLGLVTRMAEVAQAELAHLDAAVEGGG